MGVLGAGPAGRWISSGPPTEASRDTGARCSVHLFSSSSRERERSERILKAEKAFH